MAVAKMPESSTLRLVVQTGTDAGGEPVLRTRAFNRVKTAAQDADLYDVAVAIGSLQAYPVDSIQRVDEGNLVMQP